MKSIAGLFAGCLLCASTFGQRSYHVATNGNDDNTGTIKLPLKTISLAAWFAQPADTIVIHEGVYRETISPPRGGISDKQRIIYKAADGEKVYIKGSEIIKKWERVNNNTWKVNLPNSFFGHYNPYQDTLHGDWFWGGHRKHHPGAVYINGNLLIEAETLKDLINSKTSSSYWFSSVNRGITTIWVQFNGLNPNKESVEINVRQTLFYPQKTGINYITISGLDFSQAATPWSPPTAEQIGLIGTNWSKGWIIENNTISYSKCVGITLGKYGDEFDNVAATADAFNNTIQRALNHGWNVDNVGSHLVRNNNIFCCEQAGIAGSLGAIFSTISGNIIHDIWKQKLFNGAEMAGIKIHAAIDVVISNNHVYNNGRGIWLDWMAQGTQLIGNLCHNNDEYDLYLEVDHGPILVANNIFLSSRSQRIWSQGVAYVHNLIGGEIDIRPLDKRQTPFLKPHSTELAGLHDNPANDLKFYNNIFCGKTGLKIFDTVKPIWMKGNLFLNGSEPSIQERPPLFISSYKPEINIIEKDNGIYLNFQPDSIKSSEPYCPIITSKILDTVLIVKIPFENPDGSQFKIDNDYLGNVRDTFNNLPGPFDSKESKINPLKIWPIKEKK